MINRTVVVILLAAVIFSCSPSEKQKNIDSPTAGEITIVADEAYQPIVQVQIDTFMEIYKYAKINVKYLPEAEAFDQFLNNDSIRIAILARSLTPDEDSFLVSHKIIPRTLKIAQDAIALVVNKENSDTSFTYEQLGDIMRGKIFKWNQLSKNKLNDTIRIVFDRSGSSNARFLSERFLNGQKFPSNFYATNSNADVVEYVSKNKGSLGIISVNWISDGDDSIAGEFLKKIKVVALSMPDTSHTAAEYNQPYQAYIALKKYPLLRDVYIINREGRNGLGTGFASFVAGDKGQRLIRLMGLLPATMPIRIIQVN